MSGISFSMKATTGNTHFTDIMFSVWVTILDYRTTSKETDVFATGYNASVNLGFKYTYKTTATLSRTVAENTALSTIKCVRV